MNPNLIYQSLDWASLVVIALTAMLAFQRGSQYRVLAIAMGLVAMTGAYNRALLHNIAVQDVHVLGEQIPLQLLVSHGLHFVGFCLLPIFIIRAQARLGVQAQAQRRSKQVRESSAQRPAAQETVEVRWIAPAQDVDARIIKAAGVLEFVLQQMAPGTTETLGQRVQAIRMFQANGTLRDINFAIGIRNAIAHPTFGREPSLAEKERAAGYLINALSMMLTANPSLRFQSAS